MLKADALTHWRTLEPNQPILPHMEPIGYKSEGSSYGACGIRIDGTPAFIDAVMSRLQDVIDGENTVTRLELSRQVVDGSNLGKKFNKRARNAEVCYIRLHVRGHEGSMVAAVFDKHLHAPTERYAAALGVK